ncbi:hypothetical protein N2152v2_002711 [Parachlorella kessleri]
MEDLGRGGLDLQRLIGCGAGLVEVLNQYTNLDSQLTSLHFEVLHPAVEGLATVLYLQRGVLMPLRDSQASEAQEAALKGVLKQRMQWMGAAAALAKVLHYLADAAAGGSNNMAQQRGLHGQQQQHQQQQQQQGRSVTQHLRSTGFLAYLCLPAVARALGCPDLPAEYLLNTSEEDEMPPADFHNLLDQLRELHLIDDAVRGGGLKLLLKHYWQKLLAAGHVSGAASLLSQLFVVLEEEHGEALAVTLAGDGLLQAAAECCLGLVRCQESKEMHEMVISTALLLRGVCVVLDENVSPGLLTTFSTLLEGSEAQQQNGMFRDVAVSAWTCCNPDCTNMDGQREASLRLSKCAGCGEARYCSKRCQRQDWRRHKPICQGINQLK